jgi:hypothetical protein
MRIYWKVPGLGHKRSAGCHLLPSSMLVNIHSDLTVCSCYKITMEANFRNAVRYLQDVDAILKRHSFSFIFDFENNVKSGRDKSGE